MLGDGDMRPRDVELIAGRLGVSEREVVEMNRRLGGDVSLNVTRDEGEPSDWQDQLADTTPSQEETLAREEQVTNGRAALAQALTLLSERERRILVSRRLSDKPKRLEDIAGEFGVSRERVRQIEVRAFEKVQKAVKNRVAAMEAPEPQAAMAAH